MTSSPDMRTVGVALFDGFELLDVFGPLEVFGVLRDQFEIVLVGPEAGPVRSAQGPAVVAEQAHKRVRPCDVVLVPGGIGTRTIVRDETYLRRLAGWAEQAQIVASVCTGSGVLAAAGLLDGYQATSNKRSFAWARSQGPSVEWLPKARWVHDRDRWTSSGVAAGIDMTLALVAHVHSVDVASAVADRIEYEWHRDSAWDPFAAKNGLAAE